MAGVDPIPADYPRVIPYLMVDDATAALAWYSSAFDASERMRLPGPGGTIAHAELQIGNAVVMLADVSPDMGPSTPTALGGSPVTMMIYVADVDDVVRRAVAAGASLERPVEDQFYGDRAGQIRDPFGHKWFVASHVEDVSADEMERRMAELMGGAG
jgi:PhnB protein